MPTNRLTPHPPDKIGIEGRGRSGPNACRDRHGSSDGLTEAGQSEEIVVRKSLLARKLMKTLTVLCIWLALSLGANAQTLSLKKGDHICIIGNTLADRMQHSGYLESLIYTKFPEHDLVFRNLGFSGDELTVRLRSEAFG